MTTTLLALLPLLVVTFAVLACAYLLFKVDGLSRHVCRVSLLESQESISTQLHELLAMNPRAATLRMQRAIAEAALKIAPYSPVAQAKLMIVIGQQTLFAGRQRLIISKGKLSSRTAPTKALNASRKTLGHSFSRGKTRSAAFDVVARPLGTMTPDYTPSPNFSSSQEMWVLWSYDLRRYLPVWLVPYLGQAPLRSTGSCSATLVKESERWRPKLTVDKS